MSATTVAARLARREVRRRPWRSLMVLLLVALPVAALTIIVVLIRTNDVGWDESWSRTVGQEDARVPLTSTPQTIADGTTPFDRSVLPEGTAVVEVNWTSARLRTTDRHRSWALITDRPLDDPISVGLIQRLDGRIPERNDEVMLTQQLARDLGLSVGDTVELDRPAEYRGTVVGIAEWGTDVRDRRMVLGRGGSPTVLVDTFPNAGTTLLIDLPTNGERDPELHQAVAMAGGDSRYTPPWTWDRPTSLTAVVWTWIAGAVAFTILGVVISAAFAVTARRQLLLIGHLMGNGATTRTLRATLFLQGTVTGAAGAILGLVAALIGLVLFEPLVEVHLLGFRIDGFDIVLGDIIPIALVAVIASTIAALLPARVATRTTVLQALAGRRPIGPYPARLVAWGAFATIAGLVLVAVATAGTRSQQLQRNPYSGGAEALWILTGIVGGMALLLGTCAMSPAIIARLGPLAGRLRGVARLAARSIARQRTRTGAVLAATAVVVAGAMAGSTGYLTLDSRWVTPERIDMPANVVLIGHRDLLPGDMMSELRQAPDAVVAEVTRIVPNGTVVQTQLARVPTPNGTADGTQAGTTLRVVGDNADIIRLGAEERDALDRGEIVGERWMAWSVTPDVKPTITLFDGHGNEFATMPMMIVADGWGYVADSTFAVIGESTARELGLEFVPGPTVVQSPSNLTGAQREQLNDLRSDLSWDAWVDGSETSDGPNRFTTLSFADRGTHVEQGTVTTAIVALATLLSLAVVGLGLALSAAETKDERDVLAAIGAPPRALRRLAATKAAILTTTGVLIGIPLGYIPMVVIVRAAQFDRFDMFGAVFPWTQAALLLIVVPIVATLATLAASAIALRMRPVVASSMAFD